MVDYKKIESAIFWAWMKMFGVFMALYAVVAAVWLKWSDIKDWFRNRLGLNKPRELKFDE